MKLVTNWYSPRLQQELKVVRWGHFGTPVVVFPTAGGDAEEIERFLMINVLRPLIDAGRLKIYCCDSVAGRVMIAGEGSPEWRMAMLNQFHGFIYHELVPAVRKDCSSADIELIAAGASIGAFHAAAMLCRYPDVFKSCIAMSGTFDLERFYKARASEDLYFSSPLHFLPGLEGPLLEKLRTRFALITSGEGDYEDIGESWRLANALGKKSVPNRVDSWGQDFRHDWVTWRKMLPKYLEEMA